MLEILQYNFIRYALLATVLISISAPLLGVFLVARSQSIITHTISHTALAGVALSILLNFHPLIGAIVAAILIALIIERASYSSKISLDSLQALLMAGGLAVAIATISIQGGSSLSVETYLFGSILSLGTTDIILLSLLTVLIAVFIFSKKNQLISLSVSEELAAADGVKVFQIKNTIAILNALFIAISLKMIGGLLIGAMVVIPVMTASKIAKSFLGTIFWSIGLCLFAGVVGIFFSYYLDLPIGPSIVLLSITFYILALFFEKLKK